MPRIVVNGTCNVRTGDDTQRPSVKVDITIPRLRTVLSISDARILIMDIQQAIEVAEEIENAS